MKQRVCRECDNPLPANAEYCGRCGEGVRQVPIGCAIFGILVFLGVLAMIAQYLRSAL